MTQNCRPLCAAVVLFTLAGVACSGPTVIKREAPASTDLWIRNVRVINVITASAAVGRDVQISGGKIAAIKPTGAAPDTGRIIDGTGASLIPGLIDAHIHLGNSADADRSLPSPDLNLQRLLYSGVTTVFETGGMAADSFERRADVASGELIGPRIFTVGPIFTAPDGHPVPMLKSATPDWIEWFLMPRMIVQVGNTATAHSAVDEIAQNHPDAIKIVIDRIPEQVPRMTREVAGAIVERAKKHGLRTVAHIGQTQDAIDAADAGVAAWVHGVYKERIPEAMIPKLASYRIPMVPTLVVFEEYASTSREARVATPLEKELVEANELAQFNAPQDHVELPPGAKEFLEKLAGQRQVGFENVRRLHAAGVIIMAGSDAQRGVYHGPGLHRELGLLARAGLSPIDVLRAATLHPARFLSNSDDPEFGIVAAGKTADLVVVEGDPLKDVSALSKIRAVIQGGARIERLPH